MIHSQLDGRHISGAVALCSIIACGGGVAPISATPNAQGPTKDVGQHSVTVDGGNSPVLGTPCVLDVEKRPDFAGFSEKETSLQLEADDRSGAPVCVATQFRGRTTCPYGQDVAGHAPSGAPTCLTPDGQPVSVAVPAQCTDHQAKDWVFWSCRCANDKGRTDDGEEYCTCASSTTCQLLTIGIGIAGDHVSGSYCAAVAITADIPDSFCASTCDPATNPCP